MQLDGFGDDSGVVFEAGCVEGITDVRCSVSCACGRNESGRGEVSGLDKQ